MMSALLPDAEHALAVGIRRALALIHAGDLDGARRALGVALEAAELLDAERERLAVDPWDDRPDEHDLEDLRTGE
jgi:hypothetical protein